MTGTCPFKHLFRFLSVKHPLGQRPPTIINDPCPELQQYLAPKAARRKPQLAVVRPSTSTVYVALKKKVQAGFFWLQVEFFGQDTLLKGFLSMLAPLPPINGLFLAEFFIFFFFLLLARSNEQIVFMCQWPVDCKK